jgi:hypothetical protein
MEAEVRAILSDVLARQSSPAALGSRVRQRFASVGGFELDQPVRTDRPRVAELPT